MTLSQSHYFISGHEVPICRYSFCVCSTRFYCKELSSQLLGFFTMNSYGDGQACHDPSLVVKKTELAIQLIFTSGDFLLIFTISCAKIHTWLCRCVCMYSVFSFVPSDAQTVTFGHWESLQIVSSQPWAWLQSLLIAFLLSNTKRCLRVTVSIYYSILESLTSPKPTVVLEDCCLGTKDAHRWREGNTPLQGKDPGKTHP